jgi:outer membrane lipoprotein carrier protein
MTAVTWAALLAIAAAASDAAATTPTSEAPAGDIVRRVQARFDATNDFTARVQQELVLVTSGRTLAAHGTVAFKRPGRMRWVLENHVRQVIVADGKTLWLYQPEEQQVLKSPFELAFRSSSPVSFLTGVGRIDDDFTAAIDGRDDRVMYLSLTPRRDEGEIGRLRLAIDAQTYDIVGAEVRDPLGNVTKLRFTDLQRNLGIDDAQFRFVAPPGVDIIEAPIGY